MASEQAAARAARGARALQRYQARQEVHAHQRKRRAARQHHRRRRRRPRRRTRRRHADLLLHRRPRRPDPRAVAHRDSGADAGTNVGAPDPSLAGGPHLDRARSSLNGDITLGIELDGAVAPQAAAGCVQDVADGYYAGKTCHRLATSDGFAFLQCGSLDGTGASDPAFSYGPIENAPADNVYPAGTIAMARAGDDAYSNGHQFFIVTDTTTLPSDSAGGYTVVGTGHERARRT